MKFSEYIIADKSKFKFLQTFKQTLRVWIFREHEWTIWRYQKYLRKEEYYFINKNYFLSAYYRRKKNILGEKLGFTIHKFVFGSGLHIWHYGNIVVNSGTRVGVNCVLHGDNCIGNNGKTNKCPIIGDNCDIGVGAKIIGDIRIGNNVIIAAGAIVNKNILEDNVVVAGIPAKIIKRNNL